MSANMSSNATPAIPKRWSRYKHPESLYSYGAWLIAFSVVVFSIEYLNIPLDRLFGMFGRMGEVIAQRYYPCSGFSSRSRWPGSRPTT